MAYKKPQVLAQNAKQGVYAAGCPTSSKSNVCVACEIHA
jgi:hypothetical protein